MIPRAMSLIFFSTQDSPVFGTAQAAGRLVPRLRNRIEGLGDQEKQTRDLGKLFMVMYLMKIVAQA